MADNIAEQVVVQLVKLDCDRFREDNLARSRGCVGLGEVWERLDAPATCGEVGVLKFDHLRKRHKVDIEFKKLIYSVSEGRKKGKTTY